MRERGAVTCVTVPVGSIPLRGGSGSRAPSSTAQQAVAVAIVDRGGRVGHADGKVGSEEVSMRSLEQMSEPPGWRAP